MSRSPSSEATGRPAFYVGPVAVPGRLILAPMDGFSDRPFRSLCRRLGSAMSYTEFVSVDMILGSAKQRRRVAPKLDFFAWERPMVFQIYGHEPERIVAAAERVVELEPDILDLNVGCSVKSISGRGAGAGLLRTPDKLEEIIRRLVARLPLPVTAKIRLGWSDRERNYLDVARRLEDAGAQLIAVHGRTREQGYRGRADWDAIAEIVEAVTIPVLANGDVVTCADIDAILAHTACAGVMIGRGAIGNPWIFARRDRWEVSRTERLALVREHLEANCLFYGEERGMLLFRKHAARYLRGDGGDDDLRKELFGCRDRAGLLNLVEAAMECEAAEHALYDEADA